MPKQYLKVPNLRFAFQEEWNNDVFQNIVINRKEKYNPTTSSNDFKCIELDSLSQNTGELLITYNSKDQKSIKSKFYLNDVLYGKLRPYLRKYYHPMFDGVCSSEIWVFSSKILDPLFLYQYIQTSNFNELANISSGSKMPRADWAVISDSLIYYPNKDEMKKIGYFLSLLDQRIQTQNKIIEDLIALRKSIIERTFSLVNSSWNKFTFNDIFIERKEMHIKDSSVIHATLSKEGIFPKTDRYDRDFLVKDEDKKYKVSYLNDICYNPANLKFGVITRNNYGKCIISPIYVTYEVKPNFNPKFIELFVTRSAFLKEIRKYEQGTVYERMAVSSDDFLTYTTRLPDVDFQNEIVSKIDLFDKKITQEKIYLELLKNQKNYLLSNLFI